jgi:chromosome segregation ATPase
VCGCGCERRRHPFQPAFFRCMLRHAGLPRSFDGGSVMAKTAEQRAKELASAAKFAGDDMGWSVFVSTYPPLNTPIFKKNGDIGALAKRFVTVQSKFEEFEKKKESAADLFDAGEKQVEKMDTESGGLQKELDDIVEDESKSVKVGSSDNVEDQINNWEEHLKSSQDLAKERKGIFDRWMKLDANYDKVEADMIAKVKKAVSEAKAGLNSTNAELNSLEAQIRAADVKYQKTALDMSRKDIADAVRKFLAVFG